MAKLKRIGTGREPRLFSYVVHHDVGLAPCSEGRYCTLAVCKWSKSGRPNVVELAERGDWIVGTGGKDRKSAGHGRLVYAMRVTEKLPLEAYVRDRRFRVRADAAFARKYGFDRDRQALVATEFWYFGRNAPPIDGARWRHVGYGGLEKRGPGFRTKFEPEFVGEFGRWLRRSFEEGIHGDPCAPHETHASRMVRRSADGEGMKRRSASVVRPKGGRTRARVDCARPPIE